MAVNVGSVGDLATMGLAINSDGVLVAIQNLDKLATTGERTEQRVGAAAAKTTTALDTKRISTQRLGNAFQSLAVQAIGANRSLASIATLLGTFALGGGIMVAVLGGLAALSIAYTKITAAGKEARDVVKKVTESLLEQARAARLASVDGQKTIASMLVGQEFLAEQRLRAVQGQRGPVDPLGIQRRREAKAAQDLADIREAQRLNALNIDAAEAEVADREMRRIEELKQARARAAREAAALAASTARTIKEYNDAMADSARAATDAFWEFVEVLRELRTAQEKLRADQLRDMKEKLDPEIKESARIAGADAQATIDAGKYSKDMQAIWRQSVARIVTDGTKSFRDFFENVLVMFSKLMKRMEDEGKNSGALYGMLKIGGAAIGGGLAGYEVGSRTTSGVRGAGMGALSGAATGYAMGGPVGAAVGAVTGFIGGIIGSGKAARQAAREMAELQKALAATMKVLRAQVAGDDLAVTIAQIQAQTDALKKQASEAYKGRANEAERFRIQREAEALGAKLIEQAREEHALKLQQFTQDLRVREMQSQGRSIEAQELAFSLAQERELTDARKSGATAAQLATLATIHAAEAQQRAADLAREQQRALEDLNFRLAVANGMTEDHASELAAATAAQREYEDAVRAGRDAAYLSTLQQVHLAEAHKRSADKIRATIAQLEQTIGSLAGFRDSLLLSSVSNLSPTGQLTEARRQYEEILAMAKGGDQGAAGRLPGAAQTLLDFSRQVNATGGMFTVDFNKVLSDTQGLIDLFSSQKSLAERQLEELVRISEAARKIEANTLPGPSDTTPSIPWPPETIPWSPPPGGIPDSPEQRRRHEEELAAFQMVRDEIAALVRVQTSGTQQLIHGVDTVRTAVEENTTATRRGLEAVTL